MLKWLTVRSTKVLNQHFVLHWKLSIYSYKGNPENSGLQSGQKKLDIGLSIISKIHITMTFLYKVCWDAKTNVAVGKDNILIKRNDNIHRCLNQLTQLERDLEKAILAQDIGEFH